MKKNFLEYIPQKDIEKAYSLKQIKDTHYVKQEIIHFENDNCHYLEIIISGEVEAIRIDKDGNTLTVASFASNDVFGASLLFATKNYYPVTLIAKTDTTIKQIDKIFIEKALEDNYFRLHFLKLISNQTVYLGHKIKNQMNITIRDNILNYLNIQKVKQQTTQIRLSTSKSELAKKLGVQRTSFLRELRKMEADGLIIVEKNFITVK